MDRAVLRLIDANANRAREGLRVVEDYARFVVGSEELCGEIKSVRHEVTGAVKPWLEEAILQRDTPGDVGTGVSTEAEKTRGSAGDVVVAAGKRVGEALRAIEEYLKIGDVGAARKVEAARYRFYEIERRVALTLGRGERFEQVRLYVLITEAACRHPWLKTVEMAIEGGADSVQLREKELADGELLKRARQVVEVCKRRGVLCIVNDRPDIAVLAGADGVHLGQEDMPAGEARRILGDRGVIGVSTHNLAQAKQAVADGADYIGVGPIFKSATKPRDFVAGLEYAAEVAASGIRIPKVGIAGITTENVGKVMASGIRAVAVTAAVTGVDDVVGAARELKRKMMDAE